MLCALYYVVLTDLMRAELVDDSVVSVGIVCVEDISVLSDTGVIRVVSQQQALVVFCLLGS